MIYPPHLATKAACEEILLMLIYEAFAIQVSLQVLDDMDTRERETRAFVKFHNFIPDAKCLIITNSEEASLECDGIPISVLPAWKWLLGTP